MADRNPQFPDHKTDTWAQFAVRIDENPPLKKPRTGTDASNNIFFKTRLCAKFRNGACRNGENCNFAHGLEDMRQPPANWQEIVGVPRGEEECRSVGSGGWEDDQKIIHRMKLCKKFYNGEECPYGDRCNFLHEDPAKFREETKAVRESSAISIRTNGPVSLSGVNVGVGGGNIGIGGVGGGNFGIGGVGGGNIGVEGGVFGDAGRNGVGIAGFDAVRGNVKPVYWKTRLCTKWDVTGHCPFGDKCHFAHGHAEVQLVPFGHAPSETGNVGANFPRPYPIQASADAAPCQPAVMPAGAANEDGERKKPFMKWKLTKKLGSIYADWPEDLPPPHIVYREREEK